ncbi:MAG: hypothetical protein KA007_02395 [Candidatus Pacebacteria bacterium]|nr:hypothetical protein [Candidatus Paceibacterota bacterium]
MKFEQPPQPNLQNQEEEKEFSVIENDHENKSWEEKYRTEILPLIEILKPEDISFEEYENQVNEDLFESVKKIQVVQGRLLEDPEKTLDEVKAILRSRLNAGVKDSLKKKDISDFTIKAGASLVLSGQPYDETQENKYFFRDNERKIGEKIKPLFEKYINEGNFEMIESFLNNLQESATLLNESTLYYDCTPQYGGGSWKEEDQRSILLGKMPYWIFERGKYSFEENETARKLIPKVHYERNFIKDIIRDNEGLHRLGLFKDYQINDELDQKIHSLSKNEEEKRDYIATVEDTEIHSLSQILKQKAKENFSQFDRGSRVKKLFETFEKQDFEELIKSGVEIKEINPNNLPKYLNEDTRQYFVGLWKEELKKNGKLIVKDGNTHDAFGFFTFDDLQEVSSSGVTISPSELPFYKMKEFKEKSLVFFSTFKSMEPKAQEDFVNKIQDTKFLQVIENSSFNEAEVNDFIEKLKNYSAEDIKKYSEIKIGIQEAMSNLSTSNNSFTENKDVRDQVFEKIKDGLDDIESKDLEIKKARLKNIQESFWVIDDREKLPKEILETLEKFEDSYGNKGKHLISLAISAYGIDNPKIFSEKIKTIEQVLNRYNSETIPNGTHVSMGVEYEVTTSIRDSYLQESILGYKKDIELVSRSANIGKGNDGVHEIALKPTYNPYILLAEMKLLQDAGFLDLNFEKYPNAPRGYHLSLVGESGLEVDENTNFLHNVLTMSQLTGILAGKEIGKTKHLHAKSFDMFENNKQTGARVEIKGMACDTVEQFEKSIITSHNAGIAIQLYNKYHPTFRNFYYTPETPTEFQKMLEGIEKNVNFENDTEREIVFEWIKLKQSITDAVEQHNKSFIDSEFIGYFLDKNGDYIDTSEHIDVMRNKKLIDQEKLKSVDFQEKINLNIQDLYTDQQPNFVNALTNTNNIFLKPPQANENSPVNAKAVLDTLKIENYNGVLDGKPQQSIFENNGELRNGYYYIQGASEEMISHKSQIILNHFNNAMEKLLQKVSRTKNNLISV